MMPTLRRLLVVLWMAMSSAHASADIFVIVNTTNPVKSLTNKETVDLFMGRTRLYANGDHVFACDLPRESGLRADFYRLMTGMTQAQINSYWARLMFSGQVMPPQAFSSEQEILDVVKRNPGAIGYVGHEPQDKSVRVVLVMKDGR